MSSSGPSQDEREAIREQLRQLKWVEEFLTDSALSPMGVSGMITATETLEGLAPLLTGLRTLILTREYALYRVTGQSPEVIRLDRSIQMQKRLILETIHGLKDSLCRKWATLNRLNQLDKALSPDHAVHPKECQ